MCAQAQAERDGAALDYARANQNRQAGLAKEGWEFTLPLNADSAL
jgi:hypothetical protein